MSKGRGWWNLPKDDPRRLWHLMIAVKRNLRDLLAEADSDHVPEWLLPSSRQIENARAKVAEVEAKWEAAGKPQCGTCSSCVSRRRYRQQRKGAAK